MDELLSFGLAAGLAGLLFGSIGVWAWRRKARSRRTAVGDAHGAAATFGGTVSSLTTEGLGLAPGESAEGVAGCGDTKGGRLKGAPPDGAAPAGTSVGEDKVQAHSTETALPAGEPPTMEEGPPREHAKESSASDNSAAPPVEAEASIGEKGEVGPPVSEQFVAAAKEEEPKEECAGDGQGLDGSEPLAAETWPKTEPPHAPGEFSGSPAVNTAGQADTKVGQPSDAITIERIPADQDELAPPHPAVDATAADAVVPLPPNLQGSADNTAEGMAEPRDRPDQVVGSKSAAASDNDEQDSSSPESSSREPPSATTSNRPSLEENTEEEVHGPECADHGVGDLELRAELAGDEGHPLDARPKEKALGKERPDDAGTLANADERPEPDCQPSVNGPSTGSYRDTSAPEDSLRDGQVTQSCQPPTISEEEMPAPDSAELRVEQAPLAEMGPPDLDSDDETPPDGKAENEVSSGAQQGETTVDLSTTTPPATKRQPRNELGREPRRYEGLTRRAPGPGNNNRSQLRASADDSIVRELLLPIGVRLRFDRGGSCVISLIPSRSPDAPEGTTVAEASGPLDLLAMQDEWYQDVIPEDIGRILCEGAIWRQVGGNRKWSLSGRDLYVLGEHSNLSGWVSQPCLKLGRKHVILCTEQLRPAAEQALREAGVDHSVVLDVSFGCPDGWVVIRDVVPVHPVSPSERANILNALRPLPELEICLECGVRLEYATWLDGYPPLIRVYGDPAHTPEVRIDGFTACCGDDHAYRVPAWDATGTHTVWCAGISKSYSIVPFEASWELWDAYVFPVAPGSDRRVSICGPLVRDAFSSQHGWTATIQVPETNTVILGTAPGEQALAMRASEVSGMPCFASPSFRPVWALPTDPLRCSKQTTRILLLGEYLEPIPWFAGHPAANPHPAVDAWAKMILDASRKGLAIQPDTERVRGLWKRYRRVARSIWKSKQ